MKSNKMKHFLISTIFYPKVEGGTGSGEIFLKTKSILEKLPKFLNLFEIFLTTKSSRNPLLMQSFYLTPSGASLDRRSGKLIESKAKVLYEQMPVIYIYAINTTAGKDPKLYECPIYRKPQRTDLKYVGSIDFETDLSPRHWTLRGVALLCDIK